MTPKGRIVSAVVLCSAFLIGCHEHGSDPMTPDDLTVQAGKGKKGKPPPEPDYLSAVATFMDRPGDGVTSDGMDGMSPYTDGVDKVSAHLRKDPRYDWVFRLFTAYNLKRNQEPIRRLCFDFGADVGIPSLPGGEGCTDTFTSTGDPRDAAGPVLNGMLGMLPGTQITMTSGTRFDDGGFTWAVRFGIDCDGNRSPSDPGRLTVTRVTDDVWTLEASGPAILCKTPLKGKGGTTEVGPFNMPFQLTAVRQ